MGIGADISISVTRYAEPDRVVLQGLQSLAAQRGVSAEVLFLDQMPTSAMSERCIALSSESIRFRVVEIPVKGLSYARNEAIRLSATDKLLYLDADALADPGWARTLADALEEDPVAVAGSRIVPLWHGRPLAIAKSRLVLDQYSIFDLGVTRVPVRRIVGAGFGIHLGRLGEDARFDENFGRRPGTLISGEENELCERVRRRGAGIVYDGSALVHHQILPERNNYRWLFRRFFYAGANRAQFGGRPNPSHALGGWDFLALPVVLPSYIAGYIYGRLATM